MAKVLFVQDIAYEYFGVMYISAYLKANGHDCDVVLEAMDSDFHRTIDEYDPDLIAFSTLTGSFNWAVDMAARIKENHDKPVIFGGVHVYSNPEKTLNHKNIDIVCTGEGEDSMKYLCDSIDRGVVDTSIPGLWFKVDGQIIRNPPAKLIEDLDSLPLPDRTIYWKYPAIETRTTFPMLGSRGCPYSCSYCFIPTARKIFEGQGNFVRQRSP